MIRRYTDEDYGLIEMWAEKRGMKPPKTSSLSNAGFVVDECAIGFIYHTPSDIALIEYIIADPEVMPSTRRMALKKLAGTLIDSGLLLGFTNIFCITENNRIEKLAAEFGFRALPKHTVLVLNERDY